MARLEINLFLRIENVISFKHVVKIIVTILTDLCEIL